MKKVFIKLLNFFPVLILLITVNFIVDPANLFSAIFIEKVADNLLDGKNVIGMTNVDERQLQKSIILRQEECPESIIIGSSRTITISKELVGEESFRNHSMSGAGLMDCLGILGVYTVRNQVPARIMIGVDPWIFNRNYDDLRYQGLYEDILLFLNLIGCDNLIDGQMSKMSSNNDVKNKLMQLISPSYFQSSIYHFLHNGIEKVECTDMLDSEKGIRYSDGSVNYDKKTRTTSVEQSIQAAREYVSGDVYQIERYNEMDQNCVILFDKMIKYLQTKGVEIIFYFPAYHPYVYQYLLDEPKYQMIFQVETYYREYALDNSIKTYGSYNPEFSGFTAGDFFDGMHIKKESINKGFQLSN